MQQSFWRNWWRWCFPALLWLFAAFLPAQAQSPHFRKHSLPQEHGQASVTTILQDHDKFIWLGTSSGLFRFDGTQYRHYLLAGIADNRVSAVFQDPDGVLWVGYRNGNIGQLRHEEDLLLFSPEEGLPKAPITGFASDSKGRLWFSTYGEGVYLYNGKRLFNLNQDDGLKDDFCYTIITDKAGQIWVSTDNGLARCSYAGGRKQIHTLTASQGLPDNMATALSPASDGSIWVGTESKGICRYNPQDGRFSQPVPGWEYGAVTCLLPLDKVLWAGTATNGIVEIDLSRNTARPLSGSGAQVPLRISHLLSDYEGNVWSAAGSAGYYLASPAFSLLSQHMGKPIGPVQAVLQLRSGQLVYSTGTEVQLLELAANGQGKLKNLSANPALKDANVVSLYEDRHGFIWLGTFDRGIFRMHLQTGQLRQYTEKEGLVNNNVLSIAAVGDAVWLATLGGVSECVPGPENASPAAPLTFRNYTSQHGLGSNYIYQVFADSKNRLWFATDGRGVTMLDKGTFTNYSLQDGLRSNVIYSVAEDASGRIWLSTANTGIYRFTGNSFEPFKPVNGLRDVAISSLIGGWSGNLLVVSKMGIDVLNTQTGAIFHQGQELGISDIDPNLNAYFKAPGGVIWLGTQNGFVKYASTGAGKAEWPETRINSVQVFLNKVPKENNLGLKHNQNHVSFDYTGFWYHNPAEVTYQLKLEGYDREWSKSRNNFITYPNLPPGNYTFLVKASATGFFEGAEPARFSFSISPPFYNTIWFYALSLLMASGLLYWIIKVRERNLKAAERQKKEQIEFQLQTLKSQVNPHFLFNSFNTLISVIEDDQETAVEYVEKLSDFYRNILLHREKELIPLREELDMIGTYYFLQLKRYRSNFVLQTDIPEAAKDTLIAPLTLQLLVENAVKHNVISRDKPLTVEVFTDNGYLVIRNKLQPRQQHEPSTGLGLQNIVSRYRLLTKKEVEIQKAKEYFIVRLPLIPPAK